MKLTLNGQPFEFTHEPATIAALVEQLKLGKAAVAVEVNKQLVPKRRHAETTLSDGDTVEVVTLVGGG